MKFGSKLKFFQQSTVQEVISRLKNQSIYAIADEVGLGKTLVLSEVILQQFMSLGRRPPRFYVYYVAPSQELLTQNLNNISKYINDRLAELKILDTTAIAYSSRLTKVLIDEAAYEKKVGSPARFKIHIIGLSPQTSFRVRGRGEHSERVLLSLLLSFGKHAERKEFFYDWFWGLSKRRDSSAFYKDYLQRYHKLLGPNLQTYAEELLSDPVISEILDGIYQSIESKEVQKNKYGKILGNLRSLVVERLIFKANSKLRCNFLVLDEWHKYSDLCLDQKEKLCQLITMSRMQKAGKTLLISATPFKVDYSPLEVKKSKRVKSSSDYFEDLFRLVHGDDYVAAYKLFSDSRTNYLDSVSAFLSLFAESKTKSVIKNAFERAAKSRNAYIKELRSIAVRTERPRHSISDNRKINALIDAPSWKQNQTSLREFLRMSTKFKSKRHTGPSRSPLLAMYLDGKDFCDFKEYQIKGPKLREIHWKTDAFNTFIQNKYNKTIFTKDMAPLWLNKNSGIGKTLVFTSFRFNPMEICEELSRSNRYVNEVKKSGTIFGHFPLLQSGQELANPTYHWIFFYPPIFSEALNPRYLKNSEIDSILEDSQSLRDAVFECEARLIGDNKALVERLNLRKQLLANEPYDTSNRMARDLMYNIFGSSSKTNSLGKQFSSLIANEFDNLKPTKSSEKSILQISYWFLRLFVSVNAQHIYVKLRKDFKKHPFKQKTINLDFVLWYCKEFKFQETFAEYLSLLHQSYENPEAVFREFYSAMALKANKNFGKHFRPFVDSKDKDISQEDGEDYSQKTIRSAFNSPFPPYILVSTSIGQEGLDFHRYCKTIVHWSPPSSPATLQQREGRIDRYLSLQVREAIQKFKVDITEPRLGQLHPHFVVVDEAGNRLNVPERYVLFLPFSSQARVWSRCLKRMYYSDLFIGHPDPLAIEREIGPIIDQVGSSEELFEMLAKLFVNLSPTK